MTEIEATLLGAVIGGAIGVIGTYFGSVRITKRQEFNKSVVAFRATFAPTLAFLYLAEKHRVPSDKGISPSDVDKFLRDAILKQAAAIELFRTLIPESDSTAYQEAWEKYRYEVCNYGFDTTTFRTDIENPYEMLKSLIHDILSFAKEK